MCNVWERLLEGTEIVLYIFAIGMALENRKKWQTILVSFYIIIFFSPLSKTEFYMRPRSVVVTVSE